MCRVGICSLSPSLASFHVSHMCSLLLFLNAEAKVKNECWLLFELGYRFLSLPEANLHGVQFSFVIFMLAQHFIFHFFAVCFQHFSEYIWRCHWLFSFSGSFHFSLFGMVGSEKRQFFHFFHSFSRFFTVAFGVRFLDWKFSIFRIETESRKGFCHRPSFASIVEVASSLSMYMSVENRQPIQLSPKGSFLSPGMGALIGHAGRKPSTCFVQSSRQFDQYRKGEWLPAFVY